MQPRPTISCGGIVLAEALLLAGPAVAQARAPPDFALPILEAHNAERATVGAAPLAWDPALAAGAAEWAGHLAQLGRLEHSPREGRGIARENLQQGLPGWSPDRFIDEWIKERADFRAGPFPDISRTGDWNDVSHYSQMIWFGTVSIGCGEAPGHGRVWFVCRYSPGGNRPGEWVGTLPPAPPPLPPPPPPP